MKRVLISLAILLYGATLAITWIGIDGHNSPDERANALFSERIAAHLRPAFSEPLNLAYEGIISPRSMLAFGEEIVHGSFPGLPLLAGFAGSMHTALIPLASIALFVAAAVAFRCLVKDLYGEKSATIALMLFLLHPAIWYYAARPMMHNIGFVSLLILALFAYTRERRGLWFLGGVALSFALAFRTYAIIWLFPLLLFLAIGEYMRGKKMRIALVFLGAVMGVLPLFFYNYELFGGPFITGYTASFPFEDMLPASSIDSYNESRDVLSLLLPFGFHERVLLTNTFHYAFLLYPLLQLPMLAGLFVALMNIRSLHESERLLLIAAIYTWIALILIYGSWVIADNPDPNAITLANSYTRYWLPAIILSIPLAARFLESLFQMIRRPFGRAVLSVFFGAALAISSSAAVLAGEDGLIAIRGNILRGEAMRARVLAETEENAIIITEYADKFLFPDRMVIVPLREESTYVAIPRLIEERPLYYLGITLPEEDERYLTEVLLEGRAGITPIFEQDEQTLYEFFPQRMD
jgi:hypothetical protein